jgi:hypothetical protein
MIAASEDDVRGVIVGDVQFRAVLISPTGFQFTEWFRSGTTDQVVKDWAATKRMEIINGLAEFRAAELGLLCEWELKIY